MNAREKAAIVTRAGNISSKWAGPVYHDAGFNVSDYIESVIEHLQKEESNIVEKQELSEVIYDFTTVKDLLPMIRTPDEVEVGDNQIRQEILVDIAVLDRLLELIEEDK